MRAVDTEIAPSTARPASRTGARSARLRRSRLRLSALEALEARTLMATVPAALVTAQTVAAASGGNQSTPSVAVDPRDPLKLAAVWVRSDPAIPGDTKVVVNGAYSINGGLNWLPFTPTQGVMSDPATSNPVRQFAQVTDPSVAFDRNDNFTVVTSEHAADNNSGAVVLDRFSLAGGAFGRSGPEQVVYSWNRSASSAQPAVLKPVVAVDAGYVTFADPTTGAPQNDPNAGSTYVAWVLQTPPPSNPPAPWNQYTIQLAAEPNGATAFGSPITVSGGNASNPALYSSPRLTVSQGTADGRVKPGLVTVVWDDSGTHAADTVPTDTIQSASAVPDGAGGFSSVVSANVASTSVLGGVAGFPNKAGVIPDVGIGPGPTVASDNTLGSFSPHQGRLYVTFVTRSTAQFNPTDNTDIGLLVSDNGGATWGNPPGGNSRVNDDQATRDGFSEAGALSGRAQFEPEVAVDQSTGTVVVSYLDGRYDAARARVATTIAASIDGGASFGPQAFANTPLLARDEATNQVVNLGPIPDNSSAGNTAAGKDTTFDFGERQGLAVLQGHVYPAWSSNLNGGNDGKQLLNIRVAAAEIAAGPRVVGGTMGPVSQPGDSVNPPAADGTPLAQAFEVTFDRPVDPNTFDRTAVQVFYRDTTAANAGGGAVAVTGVTPLDNGPLGATRFRVNFTPSGKVGTYSYAVLPVVRDRVRSAPGGAGNLMDQSADASTGQANDAFAVPSPQNGVPFSAPYRKDTLPLIVPGPHVVDVSVTGGVADSPSARKTLMLNGTVSSVDVTFDRDMDPASITPARVLDVRGPAGPIAGPFTVTELSPRVYRIGIPTQQLSGTYTVTLDPSVRSAAGDALDTNLNAGLDALRGTSSSAPSPVTFNSTDTPVALAPQKTSTSTITLTDDFVVQGLTLTLNISDANDPDLSATLVAPDGTRIPLFSGVGTTGNRADFQGTVFDDNAGTPVTNGGPPFFGRFRPQGGVLGTVNQASSVKGPGGTGAGVYTLEITNNSAANSGTLNSWSLTFQKPNVGTGLGEPVADRAQLDFRIFTMDPTNPVASNTWTSVGPASIGGGASGRIGGLAVDPSDPSGNTVYVAGASGGVWKTNNFLTTDPKGPTYIPLTDFGPTFGIRVGGVAVFGRNNDPSQSVVVVATGEGDTGTTGVGFLVSTNAGASWALMDSTDNTLPLGQRDHAFVGSTSFKVVVDPRPSPTGNALTPSGGVIIYAALSGNNGGIWRSTDTGLHWGLFDPVSQTRGPNRAGQATDVVLDPNSGPVDAVANPTGNLQVVYGAFQGDGVYVSPNQGQVWNLMAGGVGDPLIQDPKYSPSPPTVVNNPGVNPNGAKGRIVLAKPDLVPSGEPNAVLKNFIYQGWLYAAVVTADGHLDGVYMTKDQGQNWTQLRIPNMPDPLGLSVHPAVPTNDAKQPDYDVLAGNGFPPQGNYDVSLAVDPVNPNVVYLGGTHDGNPTGVLRVDSTAVADAHAFYLGNDRNDGGALTVNVTDGVSLKTPPNLTGPFGTDPRSTPILNLIRNPNNPLGGAATFYVNNTVSFGNDGTGVKWIPFDQALGGTDQHRLVTMRDPLTGRSRLIFGDDQGVFSSLDDGDGTVNAPVGTAANPAVSRNGNLQITQFYYGAAQPSSAAAQIAGALFYGQAQDNGFPRSDPNVLNDGNLRWNGPGGDGGGVATDQTGKGTLYQYNWPCCGGNITDFFRVDGVGRTNGLIQSSGGGGGVPDPQWPFEGGLNFAVNPINGNQVVISSAAGRVFRTEDQGKFWLVIGDPAVFGNSNSLAMAFGAPDPATGGGSLDNLIYAGTQAGHIFVTFTGGGGGGNNWLDVTNGDLAGNSAPFRSIVANPTRGSHEAFAATSNGVYYIADSNPNSGQTWKQITGNLFQVTHNPFGDPNLREAQLRDLTSLAADWRYVIPDNAGSTGGPTHPMLYAAGEGGVYRSTDKGTTWTLFPAPEVNSVNVVTPYGAGGGLPDARVTDLDLSIGNVDPTTGRSVAAAGDPNVLLASTYGRGSFAIKLAPLVLPNSGATGTPPDRIFLDMTGANAASTGTATDGLQFTTVSTPTIDGSSEQSAFGNTVTVAAYDLTGGADRPVPIPLTGSVQTDANGRFSLHVAPGYFTRSGVYTVGLQATDQSGTKGNIATFTFIVDLNPPPAPSGVVLDPSSDSGTYNGDDYTFNNNSAAHPAPVYDVSGIEPGATVVLLRALQLNGVVGAFAEVNRVVSAAGGTVMVADVNGGNGPIPDVPVNSPVDTAPPQPNQYVYVAYQIDPLTLQSPNSSPGLGVIVDSKAPTTPTKITLQGASDSGASNGDQYTYYNNSPQHAAPVFDIEGIEPHATVVLLRAQLVNGVLSTPVAVNTLKDTAGGTVSIADVNGGNGPIPDSPVGSPADTAPPAGNPYVYSAVQFDLAGNRSKDAGFGNQGAIVIDGTDSDDHGSFANGANQGGWVYMQKVLPLIAPNVTNNNRVLVALGADPTNQGTFGAAAAIDSAFRLGPLPALGWTLEYVTSTADIDNFLSGKVATAYDRKHAAIPGGATLDRTGLLYITTANQAFADLSDTELAVVNRHGADIADYVNSGGGLFAQAESPFSSGVPTWGWLTNIFPGISVTDLGGGGTGPNALQITPEGAAAFPGLTTNDLSTGPWHNYFSGNLGALVPAVTDLDDGGVRRNLILTSTGVKLAPIEVVIDSTAPAPPALSLEANSDTGTYNNDLVTRDDNGPKYPAPVFDAANVEPNAVVKLYRALVDPNTGLPGAAVLVATATQGKTSGTVAIADTNAGNGVIADGTYQYTVQETDLAGNVSAAGGPLTVVIQSQPPPAPAPFALDPAFDTGTFNNDGVTRDNNGKYPAPTFDASGVTKRATVNLYRAPVSNGVVGAAVLVKTLTDTAGGLVMIADTNAGNGVIADGTYAYTAQQIDLAGNVGPISAAVMVTVDSDGPQADPPAAPSLEPSSDTGTFNNDLITQDNNGPTYPAPVFDAGTAANPVEQAATVQLFRAPVDPSTGLPGPAVLVNTLTNTAGGVVPIADTNGGNGVIPDGTYLYTVRLTDLAGVAGSFSKGIKVTVVAAAPAVPRPFRLDPASDTGVSNSDGVTQITLHAFPLFDAGGVLRGATLNLYRAAVVGGVTGPAVLAHSLTNTAGGVVTIDDEGTLPDGLYVYTVQQVDLAGNASPIGGAINVTYDTSQPPTPLAPVLDPASDTGAKGDGVTSDTSPVFDVNAPAGSGTTAAVSLVRDGRVVAQSAYIVPSAGGPATVRDPGPVPFGVHSYQVFLTDLAGNVGALSAPVRVNVATDPPGTLTLDPSSDSGDKGDNLTNATSPVFDLAGLIAGGTLRLYRNGVLVNTVPTGAGGAVTVKDPGPLADGTYSFTAQQVSGSGNASPPGPALLVTIDTVAPTTPTSFQLDPASDTGVKGDGVTSANSLTFDLAGVTPGASVQLLRGGTVVATAPEPTGGAVTVTDAGPLASGTYSYTVRQVTRAGNASPDAPAVVVKVDVSTPAGPALALDPASDTGVKGDNVTAVTNPFLDASGVAAGASVSLYRNGVLIQTVANAPGGTVMIQDAGPLPDGRYTYTARQTNVAGTTGPATSAPLVVTINTAPPPTPAAPRLALDPRTDTGVLGDGYTSARQVILSGTADPNVTINVLEPSTGRPITAASADASGRFAVTIPATLNDGNYAYAATATNSQNKVSPVGPTVTVHVVTVDGDFNGAGRSSIAVFGRVQPTTIRWAVRGFGPLATDLFGAGNQDIPVSGDFDGDGKADPAVYRPSTGQWFVQKSTNNYAGQLMPRFTAGAQDIPVPANYYGNGVTVPAVYRPSTGQFIVQGVAGGRAVLPPRSGDVPVPGNYDNTGQDELAVYRPGSPGVWYIISPNGVRTVSFGGPGDVPVPGAYDASASSRAAEPAVWRPSSGTYFIRTPNGTTRKVQFSVGDIPAPGDYDGTGVTEPAVYRPSTGQWFVIGSRDTAPRQIAAYGGPGDVPVLALYPYRAVPKATAGSAGVSAFAFAAGGLNFGASAQSMTAAPPAVAAAPPTAGGAAVSPAVARPRPNQTVDPAAYGQALRPSLRGLLIDQALSSLSGGRRRFLD